jgi:RNA polymerase sigma-B factor
MSNPRTPEDEEQLRERFRTLRRSGERSLRDEIVVEHTWIARAVARRFDQRGEAFDDLLQVASIGLVKAVDRFDPELGTNFVSFAMPTVVGEVRRYFRDYAWSVRVPRSAKELKPRIAKAIEDLQQQLTRSPSVAEIADHLHVDPDSVLEAMEASAAYRASSLDAPANGTDSPEQHRGLAQEDRQLAGVVDSATIHQLLSTLSGRSRMILYLRFFEQMSQADIAEHVGTSQVHVGRLLKAGLEQLRGQISEEDLRELV